MFLLFYWVSTFPRFLFLGLPAKHKKKAGTAVAIPAQTQTHNNIFKHARKHPHGLYVMHNA